MLQLVRLTQQHLHAIQDLLFLEPVHCLHIELSIDTFLLTGLRGSRFPFYIATAVQQGWANRESALSINV